MSPVERGRVGAGGAGGGAVGRGGCRRPLAVPVPPPEVHPGGGTGGRWGYLPLEQSRE